MNVRCKAPHLIKIILAYSPKKERTDPIEDESEVQQGHFSPPPFSRSRTWTLPLIQLPNTKQLAFLYKEWKSMAIHLSIRVAPLGLQQGGNSRIPYVHVPAARMSILPRSENCPNSLIGFLSVHHRVVGIKVGLRRAGGQEANHSADESGFADLPKRPTFFLGYERQSSFSIEQGMGKS
ncbi:hypothetical protein L6452_43558 [Arctium lappa]|uniref:Uncharacterized protein n=1 Tax=Arctium lappa TaxID=4217 RepID=A0ACB8XH33_ARCLA|nr:hypothetical protein L6452_43558 [Arctium lappa]